MFGPAQCLLKNNNTIIRTFVPLFIKVKSSFYLFGLPLMHEEAWLKGEMLASFGLRYCVWRQARWLSQVFCAQNKFCCARKCDVTVCFKHTIKTKMFPPKNFFCSNP